MRKSSVILKEEIKATKEDIKNAKVEVKNAVKSVHSTARYHAKEKKEDQRLLKGAQKNLDKYESKLAKLQLQQEQPSE